MNRFMVLMVASVTGPPTVELTTCNPGWSCSATVPYTAGTLNGAVNAAGTVASGLILPNTAVWATLVLNLPSDGRVGEYGTFVGHPTETTLTVIASFGTIPATSTLGASVLSRNEADAIGIMSMQWVTLPPIVWYGGPIVNLQTAQSGFLAVRWDLGVPASVSHIVNGAKRIYSDAVFLRQGFTDLTGLPPYLSPPPIGVAGVADLLSEAGFRAVVLAAGGPDLSAGPGFDANIINYLDPFMPDPLVLAVANVVGDVLLNRLTALVESKAAAAVTFCGQMSEVGTANFKNTLQARMNLLGLPVSFAYGVSCTLQEADRVKEAALALEYAPHRP